jgi:hypothetical protein
MIMPERKNLPMLGNPCLFTAAACLNSPAKAAVAAIFAGQ